MVGLVFRRLNLEDEVAFLQAVKNWDSDSGFAFLRNFDIEMKFSDYLARLNEIELGKNLPKGYIAESYFFAFSGEAIAGRISIRHSLNDFLFRIGGHIGYGVLPKFRRRGVATFMLKKSLPMARKLGLDRVLVTCDDDNIGSIKTIEGCGGVFENSIEQESGKPLKRRYWIQT